MLIFILAVLITGACAQPPMEVTYEFEEALTEEQQNETLVNWQWRSEASNNKTLRLEDLKGLSEIRLVLCAFPANAMQMIGVTIDEIFYSNDGDSDRVTLSMGSSAVPSFETSFMTTKTRNHCDDWNVLRYKRLRKSINLPPGRHLLTVRATTDKYGIEFDKISFLVTNQRQSSMVDFVCGAQVIFR